LAVVFALLGVVAFVTPQSEIHIGGGSQHYLVLVRWVCLWAFYVSLMALSGSGYCRLRAHPEEPREADANLVVMGKFLAVLGLVVVLFYLLTPQIVP
jgi:hypothetical protein